MTNEMVVRRAKSAKIGKTLTAYLILSPDGGEGGLEREGGGRTKLGVVDTMQQGLLF